MLALSRRDQQVRFASKKRTSRIFQLRALADLLDVQQNQVYSDDCKFVLELLHARRRFHRTHDGESVRNSATSP
jgi:hypothetical protein